MSALLDRVAPGRAGTRPRRSRAEWAVLLAVPFVVSLLITRHRQLDQPLEIFVGAIAGAFLVWGVLRRTSLAAPILFVLLPVQTVVFAWIYAQGFDAGSFRPLAALKELAVAGLLLRAERDRRQRQRALDALDKVSLAYISLAVLYLVAGRFFAEGEGYVASGRLAGFREAAIFMVVLYAARNIAWTSGELRRVLRWLAVGAGVTGVFVVWHLLRERGFTTWLVDDAQIVPYLSDVLLLDGPAIQRTLHHFIEEDVRLMGAFLSPIVLSDYLVIPFGLLLAAAVRGRGGLLTVALTGFTGFLVLETRTRVAIFALGAMVAMVLLLRRSASGDRRVTTAVLTAMVAAVLVPLLLVPIVAGKEGAEQSNQGHIDEWTYSLSELVDRPQGGGLGSNSSSSVRFAGVDRSNGNAYLLIGNELGVVGLALFLGAIGLTGRALARRLRDDPDPPSWVIGAVLAGVGLAVQGLTHHAQEAFAVSWALWLLLGLATAHERPPDADGPPLSVRSGTRMPVPG